jgi:hypothetical protein
MTTALQEGRQVDGSIANPGEINSWMKLKSSKWTLIILAFLTILWQF